ncbi:Histidine triad-like protein [Metarhizium guizhouense ARSEF 977]|uniref:Histidine triad-like protein n=1 Tax=Metarhizium guizhouense (strain ARSEF 977) TaxID=1276136 RepID=A0A0B4GAZ3_METGA|nr:Histidine triad-like protein [Metarhizium guizhouense ARSEF 977]
MFDPSPPTPDCPFCAIAAAHQPYDPFRPPPSIPAALTSPPSFVVLSTPLVVAFLDIMPLSRGHLLLCHVRVLSAALAAATGVHDWNVVQNNGAAAAQVVPHVHYHVIPRPEIRASGRVSESFTMFGRGQRAELDDDEAAALAAGIRAEVARVLADEGDAEDEGGEKAKL